ncbi:MAG TPA: hypothetical protein DEB39_09310, partial [Planctomycetaceae bacterium]|nr:hypothetical protein [Planctomycetaceae bacterium]
MNIEDVLKAGEAKIFGMIAAGKINIRKEDVRLPQLLYVPPGDADSLWIEITGEEDDSWALTDAREKTSGVLNFIVNVKIAFGTARANNVCGILLDSFTVIRGLKSFLRTPDGRVLR